LRAARRGLGRRVVVDGQFKRAEMAFRRADRALDHRELGRARRRDVLRAAEQHGDVEMIGEQLRGFDRALVAPVNQCDAFARQAHEVHVRHRLGRGGDQRGHLRAGLRTLIRPAGGLAHVHETDRRGVLQFGRDLGKQRRFLGAADDKRVAVLDCALEPLDLGPAQMVCSRDLCAAASAPDRVGVERHRVFARADQDVLRAIRHMVFDLVSPYL